jgi:hypothetical protein
VLDFVPLKSKQDEKEEGLTFQNEHGLDEKLFQKTKEYNEKTRTHPYDINLWLGITFVAWFIFCVMVYLFIYLFILYFFI